MPERKEIWYAKIFYKVIKNKRETIQTEERSVVGSTFNEVISLKTKPKGNITKIEFLHYMSQTMYML